MTASGDLQHNENCSMVPARMTQENDARPLALRLLGFAPTLRLAPLKKLFPVMWFGFAVNTFSGSGLAAAAATLPNPLFIAKIICVLGAVVILRVLQMKVFRDPEVENKPVDTMSKVLAGSVLCLWLIAMITGRLIAYQFFS